MICDDNCEEKGCNGRYRQELGELICDTCGSVKFEDNIKSDTYDRPKISIKDGSTERITRKNNKEKEVESLVKEFNKMNEQSGTKFSKIFRKTQSLLDEFDIENREKLLIDINKQYKTNFKNNRTKGVNTDTQLCAILISLLCNMKKVKLKDNASFEEVDKILEGIQIKYPESFKSSTNLIIKETKIVRDELNNKDDGKIYELAHKDLSKIDASSVFLEDTKRLYKFIYNYDYHSEDELGIKNITVIQNLSRQLARTYLNTENKTKMSGLLAGICYMLLKVGHKEINRESIPPKTQQEWVNYFHINIRTFKDVLFRLNN